VPPPSTSTAPPSERATTIELNHASLAARHRRPLPQALDTTSDEGATLPSLITAVVWMFVGMWMKYDLWLFVGMWMKFEWNMIVFTGFEWIWLN
jgi:hypothetical protein